MGRFVALGLAVMVLGAMVCATMWASMRQPIWQVGQEYWGNPWAVATLADAYCGFLLFYAWVAWRERGAAARVGWFVLIMLLGNMATALYVILQWRALRDGGVAALMQRRA